MEQLEKMLFLLAKGVMKWQDTPKLIPKELNAGLLLLMKEASLAKAPFPTDYYALVNYMQKPLVAWQIPKLVELFDPDIVLLEQYCGLSPFFQEWLEDVVSVEESEQKEMKKILDYCRAHSLDQDYRDIRVFIIKNPISSYTDIINFSYNFDEKLAAMVLECYEKVSPQSNKIVKCPYCGWTLKLQLGDWQCSTSLCKQLTDFVQLEEIPLRKEKQLWRLKKGIQRYTLIPGLPELKLKKSLEEKGYKVDLYPEVDKFDLRVSMLNLSIDIDVKDYTYPLGLAKHLNHVSVDKYHSNCYIVIPQYREQIYRNYQERVRSYLNNSPIKKQIFTQKNFYRKLKEVQT